MSEYAVRAALLHPKRPEVIIDSGETFDTIDAAVAWMNGPGGDDFMGTIDLDIRRTDMQDYYCEDVIAIEADHPDWQPTGWPFDQEWSTYTVHLQFSALSDEHARKIGAKIMDLVTQWQATIDADSEDPLMVLPQGYAVESMCVSDADDWAEMIGQEDVCCICGGPGTDRIRQGTGSRLCRECMDERGPAAEYKIERAVI